MYIHAVHLHSSLQVLGFNVAMDSKLYFWLFLLQRLLHRRENLSVNSLSRGHHPVILSELSSQPKIQGQSMSVSEIGRAHV